MSLSSAMNTAQAIFSNTGKQTQTVSKNMANVGNADYARRSSVTTTSLYGAQILSTTRTQNDMLLRQVLSSTSQNSGQQALLSGLTSLKSILGGNDNETAPSTYLAQLQSKLHDFAARPNDMVIGAGVLSAAQDVVTSLNLASAAVQQLRTDADREIETGVNKLNNLLAEFKVANDEVVKATALGADPNDALDLRDGLLKQISEIVGVSTMSVADNGLALYTTDGIALFDKTPRKVTFAPNAAYSAAATGNNIYIDGIAVSAGTDANTTSMGSLQSLLQLRDSIAPTFQAQLDEIARGLIVNFAEDGGTVPGLFTNSSGTMPAAGVVSAGLAADISISAGATATRLRDGNINGTNQNPDGNGGYSTLLDRYETGMDEDQAFDPGTGLDSTVSLLEFSTRSVSWLEALRSSATTAGENKTALLARTTEAYSNLTGVSLDEELSLLLDIEQSYKASAKLVSAIDEMLQALLNIAS